MTSLSAIIQHRQQFPALANKLYFNFGGQGTMPKVSLTAIYEAYEFIQREGPFTNKMNNWVMEEAAKTRSCIASELGVVPEAIAITEDVTVGCNIPLWGMDWHAGDRILLTDCEHPGIIAAVQEISRRYQVEVDFCSIRDTLNNNNSLDIISQSITSKTRLFVFSHVLWNTGQVLPLSEIVQLCKERSVKTLVDAAQSAGQLPLNLTESGVDFYAFTGHKWFCGPEGIGGLYIGLEAMESLNPTFIGWRGIVPSKTGTYNWKPDATRYEVATSAYPLYAGMQQAIATHQNWGTTQQRYQQILYLSNYLWQQLSASSDITCLRTSPPESGLVSFQITSGKHKELVQFLEDIGMMTRTIADPDCVRACVHYFTLESEIDQLVQNIQQYCLKN